MQVKASLGSHTCPSLERSDVQLCRTTLPLLKLMSNKGGTCFFDRPGLQSGTAAPGGSASSICMAQPQAPITSRCFTLLSCCPRACQLLSQQATKQLQPAIGNLRPHGACKLPASCPQLSGKAFGGAWMPRSLGLSGDKRAVASRNYYLRHVPGSLLSMFSWENRHANACSRAAQLFPVFVGILPPHFAGLAIPAGQASREQRLRRLMHNN